MGNGDHFCSGIERQWRVVRRDSQEHANSQVRKSKSQGIFTLCLVEGAAQHNKPEHGVRQVRPPQVALRSLGNFLDGLAGARTSPLGRNHLQGNGATVPVSSDTDLVNANQ